MSNTINYILLIYSFFDSVSQANKRDINRYKEILEQINTAIDQKEKVLHRIKEIIVEVKNQLAVPEQNATIQRHQEAAGARINRKTGATKSSRAEAISSRSKKRAVIGENKIMCQYHPQTPAADPKKQLCSSCSWKIKAYCLKEHLNDPGVVSYLKGETKIIPNVGQPMCPVHPAKPSYNKKTGLCQYCQSKARKIGVTDRKLDDGELEIISNGPVAW